MKTSSKAPPPRRTKTAEVFVQTDNGGEFQGDFPSALPSQHLDFSGAACSV